MPSRRWRRPGCCWPSLCWRGGGRRRVVLRRRGALFRAGVFAVLLGALSGPSLVEEERENLRDVVAVVLDHSASQDFDERAPRPTPRARRWTRRCKQLGSVDVRFIEAGDTSSAEDGEGTRLFAALTIRARPMFASEEARRGDHGDGWVVHDIPASLAAANLKAPLQVSGHRSRGRARPPAGRWSRRRASA